MMLDYWDEDGLPVIEEELHSWHMAESSAQHFDNWLDDKLMSGQLTCDEPDMDGDEDD